jgi:type IV secretory pathway TrbD component
MSAENSIIIHPSINRIHSVMGGEREMVGLLALFSVALILGVMVWYSIVLGIALFVVGLHLLQQMFKTDPQMFFVFRRQIKYKEYYPAQGHIDYLKD